MDKRKLMLLVGALIVAIGTAFAARSLFAGAATPEAEAAAKMPMGDKVLVAQRALPVGTIITVDSVNFQAWPKDMVQDAYFVEGEADLQKLLGTVVRNPITAGEPLTKGNLVAPGDRGFLAAALGAGMRAVTIPVSARTGVAGFVFPGDHIDLVLTQTVKGDGDSRALKASETIMKNLRVLATDQSTEQVMVEGKTQVRAFSTVTLEVTPKIAEKIAVAQTIGTISLSLRSLADNSAELEQAIASGDVKIPAGVSKSQEEALLKQAMNRPLEVNKASFVTGGDVSRFQRSTIPVAQNRNNAPSYNPAPQMGGGMSAPVNRGPVVRVTRGKDTETVPVGGK
ncbi:MAG: Flp pilus assembly protein CpaB [Novosphingobium sp. 28-62-57]|uniref:Flp pilus assembly protein CpaB n=1 Tax=unclassified Novosphingobium TaxID=2644732 RepID=UPI000BD1A938|nr:MULTISPECIES: Flp pilus assembly protein CpaB [unclassified Novosphingobium]OYW50791.1 MAG: Flp pilus assembly protein CpaB [Novosphingobium sp. 12-62-10]OYZ10071.1 MAG: Flp pilus assembly protein CpaB [Novosphingobium sp. 28-62-57]OZA32749.1 MAG: Flp pilus assembly protein CpaB [Novosphingobium sp. 17-62-9]HQS70470.1 Flp pilus assembly protein CpaB [Novosphingobium sp.]